MKQIIGIFLIGLMALPAFGQEDDRKIRIGLKIAPNVGWLNPKTREIDGDGLRAGFSFGLMGDFALLKTNNYFFSTGFEIASNGGKLLLPSVREELAGNVPTETERTYRLRYLTVPLLLKMRTNQIGYLTYYGVFGSGLSFNISANADDVERLSTGAGSIREEDIDISDDIHLLRANLVVGAGVEYYISGYTSIVMGLSWHNGFTDNLKGRAIAPNPDGTGMIDANGQPVSGAELKAASNYIALDIAVIF